MARYNPTTVSPSTRSPVEVMEPETNTPHITSVYTEGLSSDSFITLQQNLQNCLDIVDNEIMKNYISSLDSCEVIPAVPEVIDNLEQIQFFRITELVYEENEFSVHKLATVFNALSNKPCTLVLMIQSDGKDNHFYLGVRSRDSKYSTGTMRQLLEQSLTGLFPGSVTDNYLNEKLHADLKNLNIGCVSSVTCIADYKQDKESVDNQEFIQGLEKLIYSMQGKAFTSICIANNLTHRDLLDTRKEYERIYTLISPFANMQYNYALNNSTSTSDSDTDGTSETTTRGTSTGITTTRSESKALTQGTNSSRSQTDTTGSNRSVGTGKSHTIGTSDGTSESTSVTTTRQTSVNAGIHGSFGVKDAISLGAVLSSGISHSVARGKTHGTSHTDSVSDAISQNLTYGLNTSRAEGNTIGESESTSKTHSLASGTQSSENESSSLSVNSAHTKALTDTFGSSQAVTLNVQNKSLIDILQRLDKQLERLDECESIGMWDFAAYFLAESAAEAETAAGMYRSLVSGNQSGVETAAVNTWIKENDVKVVSEYVLHFLHPVFLYQFSENNFTRKTVVDATALASTNELAIHLGLPRKSVKGLPVIEHAVFAQEVLSHSYSTEKNVGISLGKIDYLGNDTNTEVELDLQSLTMHTFITGSTGSGKSNTIYQILDQLYSHDAKFLVIEPAKGEYKNVFGSRKDVSVYGTNPKQTALLRINPFSFPDEIHIYEHMDRLVEIFNVCWPMYAAMPAVLKDAIERAYQDAGWDLRQSVNKYDNRLFPTFCDVLRQIDIVMNESQYSADSKGDYKGALATRIRSLTNGINGMIFSADELSADELFDNNVIVDLSRVGSMETKSLIMGLLVMKLQEHRMAHASMNENLKHVTVLEEAHNLLKRTSTEQSNESTNLVGKSVEMLTNAIAEMRTYGEGFIIADQAPGLLDMAVIRNTNTKIILRLPEHSDRVLVGKAAGLNDDQIDELARLQKGVAAVYQNDWIEAVLCRVDYFDSAIKPYMNPLTKNEGKESIIYQELLRGVVFPDKRHLERIGKSLLKANIPVNLKQSVYNYLALKSPGNYEALSDIAYKMFNSEKIFTSIMNFSDYASWRAFALVSLEPSVKELKNNDIDFILQMLKERHIVYHPEHKIYLEKINREVL